MYILNIAKAIKEMSINEIKDFVFKNYYERIGFPKEKKYYSMKRLLANKLIGKKPDPRDARKHYRSFIKKKNTKSVKQS